MILFDRVDCDRITPTILGHANKRCEEVIANAIDATTLKLDGVDLQTTLNALPTPVDWTVDQGDTNIDSNNYTDTQYALAGNGAAGLTQYNFSLVRKDKLAGISEGADVSVQTDWNGSGAAAILNKPTWIPQDDPGYSTTDTTYTGGNNITVSASNVIAAPTYEGGTGVTISTIGSPSEFLVFIGQDVATSATPTFAGVTFPNGTQTVAAPSWVSH